MAEKETPPEVEPDHSVPPGVGVPHRGQDGYVNMQLESEEFYGLMQAYRHAPVLDQALVMAAFEAVKRWIRNL